MPLRTKNMWHNEAELNLDLSVCSLTTVPRLPCVIIVYASSIANSRMWRRQSATLYFHNIRKHARNNSTCIVIIQEFIKNAKQSFIYHVQKCMKINSNHLEHLQ